MWPGITPFEAFFWGTAIIATLLLLFKLFLGDIFDDLSEATEGEFLSLNAVLVALKAMGWIGVICLQLTQFSRLAVVAVALGSGALTFVAATLLVKRMKRLESDGTLVLSNAVGLVGTVYLTIPASGEGRGQVQIDVQGRRATVDAQTTGPVLPTGDKVFVYDVEGSTLLVVHENEMNASTVRKNLS
jgi:membrane protein implicated in regulation of membrane protease activity